MFAYTQTWYEAQACGATTIMLRLTAVVATPNDVLNSWKDGEWDPFLMTVPGHVPGQNANEGETDTCEWAVAYPVSALLTSLRSCGAVVSILLFLSWSVRLGL